MTDEEREALEDERAIHHKAIALLRISESYYDEHRVPTHIIAELNERRKRVYEIERLLSESR